MKATRQWRQWYAWLLILPVGLSMQPIDAAQVMKDVWFPDGTITWRTTNFDGGRRPGAPQAMTYLEQRTPLKLTESPQNGELEIHISQGVFNGMYGGQTKGYRNAGKNNPQIRLSNKHTSSATDARNVLLHEMGHALGFTHEFQRADREEHIVFNCGWCDLDPYNFDIVRKDAWILTPYDTHTRFSCCYQGVTPAPLLPEGALLSAHDINAIYRVYGKALDTNVRESDRFGVAVTAGDYDGDATEDIAVASVEKTDSGSNAVFLNFFKGVITGPQDDDTGTSYMPWFREFITSVDDADIPLALASGDLKRRASSTDVQTGSDDIDEVVLGIPAGAEDGPVVMILTVNVVDRFLADDMPFGGKGIFNKVTITPADVGLTGIDEEDDFGLELLVADLSTNDAADLVIGVPGTTSIEDFTITRDSGSVVYLPGGNRTAPIVIRNWSRKMSSRFGAALSVIPGLWTSGNKTLDALVIGAPGEDRVDEENTGAVYVYRMAVDASGAPVAPAVVRKIMEPGDGMRFGASVAGFLTNQGSHSWFPRFHLAVGSPNRALLDAAGGSVWLYDIGEDGSATRVALRDMPGAEAGADFGASLAVTGASCRPTDACPRGSATLAIGAPNAKVSGVRAGHVYRWTPFNNVDAAPTNAMPVKLASGSTESRFGAAIVPLRRTELRGGFVIAAPDLFVIDGGKPVSAGSALVHLNRSFGGSWSPWTRTLSKLTSGDRKPEN